VVDGREIKADVFGASPGANKPGVIWIHGGGLIFGSRTKSPRPALLGALLQGGIVVMSIDHRLAPETKLPGTGEDVHDAPCEDAAFSRTPALPFVKVGNRPQGVERVA
jgi:acetyl esterase/lipase